VVRQAPPLKVYAWIVPGKLLTSPLAAFIAAIVPALYLL